LPHANRAGSIGEAKNRTKVNMLIATSMITPAKSRRTM
jgi:hypothetical protein